jgi:hypothetical protein
MYALAHRDHLDVRGAGVLVRPHRPARGNRPAALDGLVGVIMAGRVPGLLGGERREAGGQEQGGEKRQQAGGRRYAHEGFLEVVE